MSGSSDRALLTVSEAADLAGLSKSVAYRLAASDELPGLVKLPGCRMLVRRRVLEAWLSGTGPLSATRGGVPPPRPPPPLSVQRPAARN
jgi:excisionase family DNA binding protein